MNSLMRHHSLNPSRLWSRLTPQSAIRHLIRGIIVSVLSLQVALAQETVVLDGEPFTKTFVARPQNGDKLVEFVRENETFGNWTRLIGYRYQQLPGVQNDPKKVAVVMAKIARAANPEARYGVLVSDKDGEAILHFLTWPPDQKFIELNVFRYAKSADGKAVVSVQLAYRFPELSEEAIKNVNGILVSWINQITKFEIETPLARH